MFAYNHRRDNVDWQERQAVARNALELAVRDLQSLAKQIVNRDQDRSIQTYGFPTASGTTSFIASLP
jgi:hypothetical protein